LGAVLQTHESRLAQLEMDLKSLADLGKTAYDEILARLSAIEGGGIVIQSVTDRPKVQQPPPLPGADKHAWGRDR
jgi:hypothetical protein